MRSFRTVILVLMLFAGSGTEALAAEQHQAAPSIASPLPLQRSLQSILVKLDGDVLRPPADLMRIPGVGANGSSNSEHSIELGRPVFIPLPGRTIAARLERLSLRSEGDYTWYGSVDSDPDGSVVLTTVSGHTVGYIEMHGGSYSMEEHQGAHIIVQNQRSAIAPPDDGGVPVNKGGMPGGNSAPTHRNPGLAPPEDGSRIDLLLLYTQAMATRYGSGVTAKVQNLVDLTNNAYQNSGVATRLRLVDSELFTATASEENDISTALTQITNSAEIASIRENTKADLVAMVRRFEPGATTRPCGIAWLMQSVSPAFEENAFSVTEVRTIDEAIPTYCSSLTLAHEIGHNLGSSHDRNHADKPGAYPYSYGHDIPGTFATIMSYDKPEVSYFSTPLIKYFGVYPLGRPEGQSDAADNVRSINNVAATVANFRLASPFPDIEVTPSSADFGFVEAGSGSSPIDVTVMNSGSGPLTITSTDVTGGSASDYSMSVNTCVSAVLPSGGSCIVRVTFTPTAAGVRNASLVIGSDDVGSSSTAVPLSGIGALAGPDPTTQLVASSAPNTSTGWHTAKTTVTLTSVPAGTVYFRWGPPATGVWSAYAGTPLNVPSGVHTLYYRSVGSAGGLEPLRSRAYKLDAVAPTNPSKLSSSHAVSTWSRDRTVLMKWSGAHDATSGVDGFSYLFDHGSDTLPDTSREVGESATKALSRRLKDGRWYFHLRTRDNASNWSGARHYGPFRIDTVKPRTYAPRRATVKRDAIARLVYRVKDAGTNKAYTVIRVKTLGGRTLRTLRAGWERPGVNRTVKFRAALPKGTYRFHVYTKDRARNTQANIASNKLFVK